MRQLVNSWLDHYPAKHAKALATRLRSSIDDQYGSAFYEMFVHDLVLARGHTVIAIEPKLFHFRTS